MLLPNTMPTVEEEQYMGDLERLKQIGTAKISERTHIRADMINAILNKEFDKVHAVKARGFITILEREFGIDLDDWLLEFAAYKQTHADTKSQGIFVVAPAKDHSFKPSLKIISIVCVIVIAMGLLLYALYFTFTTSSAQDISNKNTQTAPLFDPNTTNQVTDTNTTPSVVEVNTTVPSTMPSVESNTTSAAPTPASFSAATLIPEKKLWLSIIDLNNGHYEEKILKDTLEFDSKKHLLVFTGHGELSLTSLDGNITPATKKPCRFEIKEGHVKLITSSEYKSLKGQTSQPTPQDVTKP